MKLYKHQEDLIKKDPKKTGIWWGTGTGKTLAALSLAEGNTLVITTKTVRDDKTWERQFGKIISSKVIFLKVISKEDLRRDYESFPRFNTVIIDESHTICGLTPNVRYVKKQPIPKASQLFDSCKQYLTRISPDRLYLCTATPIKNPMSVLAAAWLLNKDWDFYEWRSIFYFKLPTPGYSEIWVPKRDNETKDRLAKAVKSLGVTGRLSDFTDVPQQTHVIKNIPLSKEQIITLGELPMLYPDPIVLVGKRHQVEQGVLSGNEFEEAQTFQTGKIDAILDMCEQYEKVLVFAKYTAQIQLINKALDKEKIPVYMLTGQTKDRETLIKDANNSERCVVICQSQISAGFELPTFRCTVYASESWSYIDFDQSLGRTLRINNLASNLYVYLISGKVDKRVREALENKQDFSERIFI